MMQEKLPKYSRFKDLLRGDSLKIHRNILASIMQQAKLNNIPDEAVAAGSRSIQDAIKKELRKVIATRVGVGAAGAALLGSLGYGGYRLYKNSQR